MNTEEAAKSKKKISSTQAILIVGIVLILVAIVGVGIFIVSQQKGQEAGPAIAQPGSGNVVIDTDNMDDVISDLKQKAAEGMFEVKMNSNWTFPDGTSPSTDAYVANSTANRRPFYFEVALRDTEEVIYTSPILQLGDAVRDIVLTKDLEPGKYECVCTYNTLNDDNTIENSVSVVVRLDVQG